MTIGIDLHGVVDVKASLHGTDGSHWVEIEFRTEESTFGMTMFYRGETAREDANAFVQAVNSTRKPEADPDYYELSLAEPAIAGEQGK